MKSKESKETRASTEYFSPKLYQYLYCFHTLPKGEKNLENLIGAMGVPRSTAYYNVNRLKDKGYLVKRDGRYDLTAEALSVVAMDRDTLDDLTFWLQNDLKCGEDKAREVGIIFMCRLPVNTVRRLARAGASRTALSHAGEPAAHEALAALPLGRHDALFSVRRTDGSERGETDGGHTTRKPAVFIVGNGAACALELCDAHIRRIVAIAMPRGYRAMPARLLYERAGRMTECRAFAGRWHMRGDAVIGRTAPDGRLTGCVRVAATNARGKRFHAEIVLRFADGGDEKRTADGTEKNIFCRQISCT
jgi:DNA-binding MarR family transcriptional regulator